MTITLLTLTFLTLVLAGTAERRYDTLAFSALTALFAAGAVLTWFVSVGRL